MKQYRNMGAPFTRDDGSKWERDAVHAPTENELRRRLYKLRAVLGIPTASQPAPSSSSMEEGEWPLQMRPEVYAKLHPTGPHAELARKLLAVDEPEQQEEEGADSNGAADE